MSDYFRKKEEFWKRFRLIYLPLLLTVDVARRHPDLISRIDRPQGSFSDVTSWALPLLLTVDVAPRIAAEPTRFFGGQNARINNFEFIVIALFFFIHAFPYSNFSNGTFVRNDRLWQTIGFESYF